MQAFGLYGHIRSNRRRSVMMLGGLFILAYGMAYGLILIVLGFSGNARIIDHVFRDTGALFLQSLPFVTLGVAAWIFIGFRINVGLIAMATGARGVTREAEPKLCRLLETLCISRGLTVPRLMIMENPALNAFASGVNDKQFTVTVTRGLLEALSDAELEAVLAHELTHIRNGDVKMMVIAVVIAGVVSFFGEMVFRMFSYGRPGRIGGRSSSSSSSSGSSDSGGKGGSAGALILIGIALLVVSWILALVLRFALSRSREYLADAGAVELTKNPDAMISALLKISGRADIDGVPSGIMDMCVENDPDDWGDMFATHPSIAKRIQSLVTTAGGRMPEERLPGPPKVAERSALPMEAERRGPWGPSPAASE
jgi:heat shock protein HtpX